MSAAELSKYASKRGVLPKQIKQWRVDCEKSDAPVVGAASPASVDPQARERIQVLERELRRKDVALAETAALLVLRKKAQAIWEAWMRTHDLSLRSPASPPADR